MEDLQNPYAAPSAPPPLPAYAWVDDRTIKADPWIRLVARLIDWGLMMVCFFPLFVAVGLEPDSKDPSPLQLITSCVALLAALGLFIYQLVLLAQSSQTLGKRWMRIKIVRNDGTHASFGRIFGLRMLVVGLLEQVPCIGLMFSLINVVWIFGEESRCLHDLLADTKVVIV
ncbi:RDD family protein [Lysobacter capsici]|uniref:RDD family protein n=1 Tax=Lysobacter capsici TaxID=435897 RepID=UPI001C008003|nr:RDD family protein [Lysobacter capsici]QWF16795.1 RDD family protein [Lysobacter capsici]